MASDTATTVEVTRSGPFFYGLVMRGSVVIHTTYGITPLRARRRAERWVKRHG